MFLALLNLAVTSFYQAFRFRQCFFPAQNFEKRLRFDTLSSIMLIKWFANHCTLYSLHGITMRECVLAVMLCNFSLIIFLLKWWQKELFVRDPPWAVTTVAAVIPKKMNRHLSDIFTLFCHVWHLNFHPWYVCFSQGTSVEKKVFHVSSVW